MVDSFLRDSGLRSMRLLRLGRSIASFDVWSIKKQTGNLSRMVGWPAKTKSARQTVTNAPIETGTNAVTTFSELRLTKTSRKVVRLITPIAARMEIRIK